MRPKRRWAYGYSSRAAGDRLELLCTTAAAKQPCELVEPLDRAAFATLVARSLVNLEQARAGLRISLVANITVPLGAVVFYNQAAPGWLATLLGGDSLVERAVAAGAVAAMVLVVVTGMWWAHGGVSAARDLNHLLHLIAAEKFGGAASGAAPAAEDDEPFQLPGG